MSRDLAYLEDMRLNAEYARSFVNAVTFAQFADDRMINYSVVRCLTIIGEAANRVSSESRASLPQLDWSGMIGLRHVVVHDYGRVDLKEVWEIVHRDLPPLIETLTAYMESH